MRPVETHTYKRIDKRTARFLYNAGYTIYLTPCKIRPDNQEPFIRPLIRPINKKEDGLFDERVNAFEYYNCNHHQLGYYAAFYIKEE